MLFTTQTAEQKRIDLRNKLRSGKLQRFPGSFSPLTSRLIEDLGFDGVYISGAVLSADLAFPDIGLTTLTEVSQRGRLIARATALPSLIDIDTGFGEPMNVARTLRELEELGLSGCHIEDQINPKRCGHLDNKGIVSVSDMTKKISAMANARRDSNFLICARTDSRAVEGLEGAIQRAKAYVDAGAEMIFPEAMQDESEFAAMRKVLQVPILANMTEFGKSKLLTTESLQNLGINLVIYPVTTLRIAMGAVEAGLKEILTAGTQEGVVSKMQTRKRLYELIDYEKYNEFDQSVFNFSQSGHE